MQTFNLKKEWFEKIKSGEKTHEYRELKSYWIKRLDKFIDKEFCVQYVIRFCLGYPKANEQEKILYAKLLKCSLIDGQNSDLKINNSVFDIHFELIKGYKPNIIKGINVEKCKFFTACYCQGLHYQQCNKDLIDYSGHCSNNDFCSYKRKKLRELP